MRLGGWSRLWIVVIALYAVGVAAIAYLTRPLQGYIEYRWTSEAIDVISTALSGNEDRDIPSYRIRELLFKEMDTEQIINWLKQVAADPSVEQRVFSDEVAVVNDKYQNELDGLPNARQAHYTQAILLWLFPSAALFALGWLVGWVIRGFRNKN